MNLSAEDIALGNRIVETCLKLDDDKIEDHIQKSLNDFLKRFNISKLDHRNIVYEFLKHQSTLFMNYNLNSALYLLSVKEKIKADIGIKIINKIIDGYTKTGL